MTYILNFEYCTENVKKTNRVYKYLKMNDKHLAIGLIIITALSKMIFNYFTLRKITVRGIDSSYNPKLEQIEDETIRT